MARAHATAVQPTLTSPVTPRATIRRMADEARDRQPDDPDAAWYSPNAAQPPPRQRQPGELLYEFHVPTTHTFWRVELRDHGPYGMEVQFPDPIDVRWARTSPQYLDPTWTPREMAIAWAEEHRRWVERDQGE